MAILANDGDLSGHTVRATSVGAIITGVKDPYAVKEGISALDAGKGLLFGAMGPAGIVASFIADKVEGYVVSENNKPLLMEGIKVLSEKGVPGFGYINKMINGEPIKIAVDASALINNPDTKPYTLTDASRPDDPKFSALRDALSNKAASEALGFVHDVEIQNGDYASRSTKYERDLQGHLDRLQAGEHSKGPGERPMIPTNASTLMAMKINQVAADVTPKAAEAQPKIADVPSVQTTPVAAGP